MARGGRRCALPVRVFSHRVRTFTHRYPPTGAIDRLPSGAGVSHVNAYAPLSIQGAEPTPLAVCSLRGASAKVKLVARDVETLVVTKGIPSRCADGHSSNESLNADSVRRRPGQARSSIALSQEPPNHPPDKDDKYDWHNDRSRVNDEYFRERHEFATASTSFPVALGADCDMLRIP